MFKGCFVPLGKAGSGHYGSTLGKENTPIHNPNVITKLTRLAKDIPLSDGDKCFNLGDYGTADGAASMSFVKNLIVSLREHHGSEISFQIIYEDLPISDFNSLFRGLSGMIPDRQSYLQELDDVFPLASGISFRKQCVPSDSMHFILSMKAIHWLSRTPVQHPGGLYLNPDSTDQERETLVSFAKEEWITFLLMRSKELKRGGLLMITSPAEFVDRTGRNNITCNTFLNILTDIWKAFRDSGKITKEEFLNTNLALYMYRLTDLTEPFESETSVYKSGLRLLSAELLFVPSVHYKEWRRKMDEENVDDRAGFARNYLAVHWNWSNGMFATGLSADRSEEDRKKILEELYGAAEKAIEERCPDEFKEDMFYQYALITKE